MRTQIKYYLKENQTKYLKNFLDTIKEAKLDKIYIPALDKVFDIDKQNEYFNFLLETQEPFYIGNYEKGFVKVKNRRKSFKLQKNKFRKTMFSRLGLEINKINIIVNLLNENFKSFDKIKREKVQTNTFSIDLFTENIKKDLPRYYSEIEMIDLENDMVVIRFKNYSFDNYLYDDEIEYLLEYLNDYKETLSKTRGIDFDISLRNLIINII